jgi:hypothetical protein
MSDFDSARLAALIVDLLNLVQGRTSDLLSFGEVRERLRLKQVIDRGVQEVPLSRIVGSLGREREFNRAFLPREESLRDRWQEVKDLAEGPTGFPPVELYYVNDVYFVVDGHHRVSVARALGAPAIEARVKEFISPVPLTPETSIEEVILKSGLADFLDTVGLEQTYPGEFELTEPNGYERLLDHISVHRYYLGLNQKRDINWREAVHSWLDTVYRPMIDVIRKSGVMEQFPGRTETDLYLYVMDHLHHLKQLYGNVGEDRERVVKHFQLSSRESKTGKLKSSVKKLFKSE